VRHVGLAFALHAGNILLPLRGGELLRPLYVHRTDPRITLGRVVGWTLVDKAVEVLSFVPFVLCACHVFATDARFLTLSRWAWPIGGALGATVLVGCVVRLRGRASTAQLLGPFAVSLGVWAASYLIFYLAVPDARLALAILVGVNAALVVPALPAAVGTYEAAFVAMGALGGWPPDRLLAAALVSHGVQIAVTLAVGGPLLAAWGWPRRADPQVRALS
jgi:uncharacterized membrane protein YbhN (UPF0104 family)